MIGLCKLCCDGWTADGIRRISIGSSFLFIRQRFSVPLNPLTSVQVWTNRNVLEGKSLPFIRHPFEPCIIRGFR